MRGAREGERYVVGWRSGGGFGVCACNREDVDANIPCRVAGRRVLVLGAVFLKLKIVSLLYLPSFYS